MSLHESFISTQISPVTITHGIELKQFPEAEERGSFSGEKLFRKYSYLRSSTQLEEYEVPTSYGITLRVYAQPSNGKNVIITFHDIGTNHNSFLGFFSYPEMQVLRQHFKVYHICAPGHHEGADPITVESKLNRDESNQRLLPNGSLDSQASGVGSYAAAITGPLFSILGRQTGMETSGSQYPNMDQLADMVGSVADFFSLKYFVGFGMGAGSNVFARYALRNPNRLLGLFLINPNATTHGYYQWLRNRWSDLPQLQRGIFTDNLLNQLEAHWFGGGMADNPDLVEFYGQLTRSLNPVNLAGYIDSYINRTDLGLTRPPISLIPMDSNTSSSASESATSGLPSVIRTDVCLVTGDRATDLSRILADMNGRMDPKLTQFILVPDCTGMLMEENPDKLALNFLHFLRNIGLVINMTPEKLHKLAVDLQVNIVESLNSKDTPTQLFINEETC